MSRVNNYAAEGDEREVETTQGAMKFPHDSVCPELISPERDTIRSRCSRMFCYPLLCVSVIALAWAHVTDRACHSIPVLMPTSHK